MSNNYVENENGFFVKLTLFKDDINKRNFYLPLGEETTKQLSRSLGKIPYIDITKVSKGDDHMELETRQYIAALEEQGLSDDQIISKVWEMFEPFKVGTVVDIYDVSKGSAFGSALENCDQSMKMVQQDNPNVAVLDFLVKIENEDYKQQVREGKVSLTPSPSIYGTYRNIHNVSYYDPTQYLDFLHV